MQQQQANPVSFPVDPDNVNSIIDPRMHVFVKPLNQGTPAEIANYYRRYQRYFEMMPNFTYHHRNKQCAGHASAENNATVNSLAFQGTFRLMSRCTQPPPAGGGGAAPNNAAVVPIDVKGSGHHGVDYIGVASVRAGKGYKITGENLQTMRQV
jgi:hypothetical protein